jgi:hypothetical protein
MLSDKIVVRHQFVPSVNSIALDVMELMVTRTRADPTNANAKTHMHMYIRVCMYVWCRNANLLS